MINHLKKVCCLFCFFVFLSGCGNSTSTATQASPVPTVQMQSSTPKATQAPKPSAMPTPAPVYNDGLGSDGKIHVYIKGDGEKVKTPDSSFIDYIIYYAESKHMIICMNGKEYTYANVSESLWEDFASSESKGSFYKSNIKGKTKYNIKDYDGTNGNLIVVEYID